MNVINKLSQKQIVDVMIEYFTRHFKLLEMMDDIKDTWEASEYNIFSKTYTQPSLESFRYILERLAAFKMSYVTFYWIIAVFDDMLKKERLILTGEVIHNFVILFYNIGSKLIEDVPYSTSVFIKALNIDEIHGTYIEMYLMQGIISYSSPYTILWQKHIDYKLYCVISHIVNRPILTIINIDKFDKDNKGKFYNQ